MGKDCPARRGQSSRQAAQADGREVAGAESQSICCRYVRCVTAAHRKNILANRKLICLQNVDAPEAQQGASILGCEFRQNRGNGQKNSATLVLDF